jgi:ribA/ribD-fused uncharacterized protein
MYFKLKERCITFGKLLDLYDAGLNVPSPAPAATTTNASTQCMSDPVPDPDPPQSNSQEYAVNDSIIAEPCPTHSSDSQPDLTSEPEPDPIIVKGKDDPRSNFYRFSFTYGHITYKSLEHAYQSIKASMCGYAALAWDIRMAPSPQIAKRLANRLPKIATKNLHDLMFDLLKAKISQCYSFRQSLRATGTQRIFHSTYKDVDLYWCTGLRYDDIDGHKGEFDGLNVFGQMLERIRDEYLLDEKNYETRVKFLEGSDFVILLHDGEANFYHTDSDFYRRGSGYHRYNH